MFRWRGMSPGEREESKKIIFTSRDTAARPPTHLRTALPACRPADGRRPSQRCESGAHTWDTGRRSCSEPDRGPAARGRPSPTAFWKVQTTTLGFHITGTLTFLNISAPLRASSRAMSWGVDTMTAPETTQKQRRVQSGVHEDSHQQFFSRTKWTGNDWAS